MRSTYDWSSQGGKLPRCVLPRTGTTNGRFSAPQLTQRKWTARNGQQAQGYRWKAAQTSSVAERPTAVQPPPQPQCDGLRGPWSEARCAGPQGPENLPRHEGGRAAKPEVSVATVCPDGGRGRTMSLQDGSPFPWMNLGAGRLCSCQRACPLGPSQGLDSGLPAADRTGSGRPIVETDILSENPSPSNRCAETRVRTRWQPYTE